MSSIEGQALGWMAPALAQTRTVKTSRDTKTNDAAGETIAALVAEYSTTLYRVAYSVTRNPAEAEDAVQETFMRVLRHQSRLPEVRDMRVWLVRIVWNVVLDKKRRIKTRPETADIEDYVRTLTAADPTAEQDLVSSRECARILRLVDRLPAKERQAILLSAVEEMTTAEIARVLRTTESSVRSRIFRARKELALLLGEEENPRG